MSRVDIYCSEEIKEMVKSWSWNLAIWDIYELLKEDELKWKFSGDKMERYQSRVLSHAREVFNDEWSVRAFEDMGSYFGVDVHASLEAADKWFEKEDKEMEELV